MKIQIEVELGPDEIGLATELLNTLRTFTSHVQVTQRTDIEARTSAPAVAQESAQAPGLGPAAPPARPAAAYTSQQPNGHPQQQPQQPQQQQQLQQQPQMAVPPVRPQGPPAAAPPAPVIAPQPAQPPQHAMQQPAAGTQPGAPAQQATQAGFEAIIHRISPEEELNGPVAVDLNAILAPGGTAAYDVFFTAFLKVAFRPEVMDGNSVSVKPYMMILGALIDPWQGRARDQIIHKVLKHLTIKRPLDVQRTDFFAHAEAFAALVLLTFVSVPGAIQTIAALLKKPDNRCAAITMMGKTVELCFDQIQTAEPAALSALRAALQTCEMEHFKYDLEYINETMGWV